MASSKNLVIVESPAKAKTISKFLGSDYSVLSSAGHIRDLKPSSFSVDIDNHFAPEYEIPHEKHALVKTLKQAAEQSETVWLASDEDREGEAIAWHLYEVLERAGKPTQRIVFHEITEEAIKNAIAHPRQIDKDLVDAQQARRVLDRIVGFELSPVLWRKVRPSLSAGRVQSVALRLIVDREKEIRAFVSESRFRILGDFEQASQSLLRAECDKEFDSEEEAMEFVKRAITEDYRVIDIQKKPGKRSPSAPFTTSTLQQEASRKLGYSVSHTMSVAQKLYESGLITYMRTDSTNLSNLALNSCQKEITSTWGEAYHKRRLYRTKAKGAQEAHEAIRPTYIQEASIKGTKQEMALYDLIRKRTLASQMSDAEIEKTVITIANASGNTIRFSVTGERIVFDGFLALYLESRSDEETTESTTLLSAIEVGESLTLQKLVGEEKYSRAPARYSEASLVKKMEELGIGRPSTYAPTIQTIQNREYVKRGDDKGQKREVKEIRWDKQKHTTPSVHKKSELYGNEKGKLLPTDIGWVVTDFLIGHFPDIIDYHFTAHVEEQFDRVAMGEIAWQDLMAHFYAPFHSKIEENMSKQTGKFVGERILGNDPKTGKRVSVRIGRFGPMVQMGEAQEDSDEKPLFAKLTDNLSITTISLEEALKLFELPRRLGMFEESTVDVAVGRFGPYIKHSGKFVSIPKDFDPMSITLDECITLIQAKREAEEQSLIRVFDEDPTLSLRDGRFGVYIKHGKNNYKLTKEQKEQATTLSYADCLAIIEAQPQKATKKKPAKKTKARTTAKK